MNLALCTAQAHVALASSKTLHQDFVFPRREAFMALAYGIVELFNDNANITRFQLTVMAKLDSVEDELTLTPRVSQHFKVSVNDNVALASREDKLVFFSRLAPYHLMAGGTFSIERSSDTLQAILGSLEDAQLLPAHVYRLATLLDKAFKSFSPPQFDIGEVL